MARFDVYRNNGTLAGAVPFLVEVQSEFLETLDTRVVVPLRKTTRFPVIKLPSRLTPIFEIEGISCLMETPKIAAIPVRSLKHRVLSLRDEQAIITAALDFLFQGF